MDTKLYPSKAMLDTEEYNNFVQIILNSFSTATGSVFAMYDVGGHSNWCSSNDLLSPLCKFLQKDEFLMKFCEDDHRRRTCTDYFDKSPDAIMDCCCFGLWNISYPIFVKGKLHCTLITGQKRLLDEKEDGYSIEIFNSKVSDLLETGQIDKDTEQNLINLFDEVPRIDSLETSALEHLANVEENFIKLIENIDKQFNRRVKRLTLTRHELHRPNINVKNLVLKAKASLHDLFINSKDIETKTLLSNAITDLEKVVGYSKLFSIIIENISSSYRDGFYSLNAKELDIVKLVSSAIDMNILCAENKDVVFEELDVSKLSSRKVQGDEGLLFRAFVNIYQNAVKYSFTGHKIHRPRSIRTNIFETDSEIIIKVSNYGIGITAKELETKSIWEEGIRGVLSSERHRTGSGLGLPQILKIAQQHNGTAQINSVPMSENIITGPYLTILTLVLPRLID